MAEKHEQKPQRRGQQRIPEFASREEMAAFWDTHDASDYWDELKPVQVRVAKDLGHIIQIELDSETFRALCSLARKKRVNPINMAKKWILERLREEE